MAVSRKKPCSICRRWFLPDPRIGERQRACHRRECQVARRKKAQAAWCAKNPNYFIARRMQARSSLEKPVEPLRMAAPLSGLPWDLAQDEFGVQGTDFIGVMARLLRQAAQDELKAHVIDCIRVVGTHAHSDPKDEMRLGP